MLRFIAKLQTRPLRSVRSTAERGATAVEYGLIVALLIGVGMWGLPALGTALSVLFGHSTSAVVVP
jgi:Flp pilus assembly pilin Flp